MTPRPKRLTGPSGNAPGPRERRDLQRGTKLGFPLREERGEVVLQVDPRGAIGTDPARGLYVRAGDGLAVEQGSPYRLVIDLGDGLEVQGGRVVARVSTSVLVSAKGELIARPTTMEVVDPDPAVGTLSARLDRKANTADARFVIARGRATLSSGYAEVAVPLATSDSVAVACHGTLSGTQGMLSVAVSDGVGVGISSSDSGDNSEVHYAVWST